MVGLIAAIPSSPLSLQLLLKLVEMVLSVCVICEVGQLPLQLLVDEAPVERGATQNLMMLYGTICLAVWVRESTQVL